MKNAIDYYYGLKIETIHQKNKDYYFSCNNSKYLLTNYDNINIINQLYELSNNLVRNGLFCHQIIPNNNSEPITKINENLYVLLKITMDRKNITYNDILLLNNINFENKDNPIRRDNWYLLWTNKVDNFEYQINQSGKKYPLITESFSYYIGLAENAIALINSIDINKIPMSLNHNRIKHNYTTYDLYNPLNFVIDYRVRDMCEYFKDCFYNDIDVLNDIINYLHYNQFDYNESCCFFARLLFPTYYFDMYEEIVSDNLKEDNIKKIIYKINDFEILISRVYFYLKKQGKIPIIEWLDKLA